MTFETIVAMYDEAIVSAIRFRLGAWAIHGDLVDDIKQDVLIRLLTMYREGKLDDVNRNLFCTIAIGTTVDHIRHMSSRPFMFEQIGGNDNVYSTPLIEEENIDLLIQNERSLQLDEMLLTCSESVRSVFELRRSGLAVDQVAAALGLTSSNVRQILSRYTNKFREMANVVS